MTVHDNAVVSEIASRVQYDEPAGCWIWTGAINANGYPRWGVQWAHRRVYEMAYGSIPDGLHIDHLCRVPRCVRPSHLEAVTQAENNRRAFAAKAAPVRCKWGHDLADAYRYGNETVCRVCIAWRTACVHARRRGQPLPDAVTFQGPVSARGEADMPCRSGCGRLLRSPAGRAAHERRCLWTPSVLPSAGARTA